MRYSLLLKFLKERECFLEKNYSVTLLIGGGGVTEHASDITAAAVLDCNQCGSVCVCVWIYFIETKFAVRIMSSTGRAS